MKLDRRLSIKQKGITQRTSSIFFYFLIFLGIFTLLLIVSHSKIVHSYLEDDMLWFVPLVSQTIRAEDLPGIFKAFHSGELTFTDGLYFSLLITLFGFQFKYYVLSSLVIHFANTVLFFLLLKNKIKLNAETAFVASVIFMVFFGHFHAYLWPLTSHHLLTILFIFIILHLYLKTDEIIEQGGRFQRFYWLTLGVSLVASFLPASILLVPLIVLVHLLFTTEDKDKVISKYVLWIPLFIIFMGYQIFALVFGGVGDVLDDFLEIFYQAMGKTRDFWDFCLFFVLGIFGLFLGKFILQICLRNKTENVFFRFFRRLFFVAIFFPKMFALCLSTFFFAPLVALSSDPLIRWHPITFLSHETLRFFLYLFALVMLWFFISYAIRQNRHMALFVPWYMALWPYLGKYGDALPSRYFLYLSPIFCVVISIFFLEIIPRYLPKMHVKKYLSLFYLFVVSISLLNLGAIRVELFRKVLIDNHWAYDYIKISHLVKNDFLERGRSSSSGDVICLQDLRNIPHIGGWQPRILQEFDFSRFDTFREILASVFEGNAPEVVINKTCPQEAAMYRIADATVYDSEGKSIEPFYQSFKQGVVAFEDGKPMVAALEFKRAITQKPFLIRFMMEHGLALPHLYNILLEETSDNIYRLYSSNYDGEEKMIYIDNLIQREAKDFGMALALLSYLKHTNGNTVESEQLLKEALLFVSREDILSYPWGGKAMNLTKDNFYDFIEANDDLLDVEAKRQKAGIPIESHRGFQVIFHNDFFFALPYASGDFDLVKFKLGDYHDSFVAQSKYHLHELIDQHLASHETLSRRLSQETRRFLKYRDFWILKSGDLYYCFLRGVNDLRDKRLEEIKDEAVFTCRSSREAQLIIDHYFKG